MQCLARRTLENLFRRRIEQGHQSQFVQDNDTVGHAVQNRLESLLPLAQRFFGFLPPGNVLGHGLEFDKTILVVKQGAHHALLPDEFSRSQDNLVVESLDGGGRGQPGKLAQRDFTVLLGQGREKIGADQLLPALAMEAAVSLIDEDQRAIRLETADLIRLILDHAAITPFAFEGGADGRPAFDRSRSQEQIADRDHAKIAANEHQAGLLVIRPHPERPLLVQ